MRLNMFERCFERGSGRRENAPLEDRGLSVRNLALRGARGEASGCYPEGGPSDLRASFCGSDSGHRTHPGFHSHKTDSGRRDGPPRMRSIAK